jgi:DNA-binding transcriptional MerR regulator/precorrin-6B methylase 2
MAYTVTDLAGMSSVSLRTLRWYDEIGLLKPAYLGVNGYRYYEEAQLLILQQILFFKELGFNLKSIQQMLTQSDFDNIKALGEHRKVLEEDIARKSHLLVTIDKTLEYLNGNRLMLSQEFYYGFDRKISMPQMLAGNKSPALNGTGYVYYTTSPVSDAFLRAIPLGFQEEEKTVIDIGAGYSNVPIEALNLGVAKYIANDMSEEHLYLLVQRVKEAAGEQALNRLKLIHGRAPYDLPKVQNAYDAILAEKVMHFMSPTDVKEFIAWAKDALKPGGKIYATVSSPYSKRYRNMLGEFHHKLATGAEFPGHFTNMMNTIDKSFEDHPGFKLPDEMLLFSLNGLIKIFENNGLWVIASYSMLRPTANESEWIMVPDTESELVGVVAMKPM